MKYTLVAAVALACVAGAVAECPNACSGHGTCGTNDMCSCYRNWQAADCSERTCPFGWSFATSPQGDLNFDGDRFDNSYKPLVYKTDTGSNTAGEPILANVEQLSDQLIFNGDIVSGELIAGDCVLLMLTTTSSGTTTNTPKKFCISAVSTNSPTTTFTLDAPNDASARIENAVVYKFLENIAKPEGTWESWPGYATVAYHDEGHFYMECSNKGLCDRSSGQCMCFEGYEGFACSRTTCPAGCSGHGTCMSVKELSVAAPNRLSFGGDTVRGSSFVATTTDPIGTLAAGDKVFLGEQVDSSQFRESNLYTVGRVSEAGFEITPPALKSLSFGSTIYHAASYKLWDADKNFACKCDPGFAGHSCAERACPAGADPLDTTGEDYQHSLTTTSVESYYTRSTETQTLELDSSCGTLAGSFALTHTDQVTGERVSTGDIEVSPELSSTVTVIEPETSAGDAIHCPTQVQYCYKKVVFTPHLPQYELSTGDFIRVGNEYRQIAAVNVDTTSGNYSYAWTSEAFQDSYSAGTYAYRMSSVHTIEKALEGLPNGAVVDAVVEKRVGGTQLNQNLGSGLATAYTGTNKYTGAVGAYETVVTTSTATLADASTTTFVVTGEATTEGLVYKVNSGELVKVTTSAVDGGNSVVSRGSYGSTKASTSGALTAKYQPSPISPSHVCVGDIIGSNGLSTNYYRQVEGTVEYQTNSYAIAGAGAGGFVGLRTQRLCGNVGPVDSSGVYAPASGSCDPVEPAARNPIMRLSGARYEIQTDVDGDPTELACDTSSLRSVYVASSAGYVSRDEPRKVLFVDHRWGSNQPSLRPLSADGDFGAAHPQALSKGDVIYVGNNKCTITSVDHSGSMTTAAANRAGANVASVQGGGYGAVMCEEVLQETAHSTAAAIAVNEPVHIVLKGSTQSCHASDYRALRFQVQDSSRSSQALVDVTDANSAGDNRKVRNGADTSATFLDTSDISIGDRVMIEVNTGKYETRTIDSIDGANTFFTVSKGFTAAHADKRMWIVGKGSKSQQTCAGRGLCDDTTGQCVCFRGYTKQACEEQSALAA